MLIWIKSLMIGLVLRGSLAVFNPLIRAVFWIAHWMGVSEWPDAVADRVMLYDAPPSSHRIELQRASLFIDPQSGFPYLLRRYLTPSNGRLGEWWRKHLPGVYLHYFYRSDYERELHNHPWEWAVSLILAGGYIEIRQDEWRERRPGETVILHEGTFHRVELCDEVAGCWSLFIAGPRVAEPWGFISEDGNFIDHEEYHARVSGSVH